MRACWCVRPPVDAGFCLHELVRVISLRRAPSSRPPRNQVKELLHRRGELLKLLEGRGEWLNGPFNDRLFLESSALGDSRYEERVYRSHESCDGMHFRTAYWSPGCSHWRAIARPAKKPAVEKFKSFAVSGNFWRRRAFA